MYHQILPMNQKNKNKSHSEGKIKAQNPVAFLFLLHMFSLLLLSQGIYESIQDIHSVIIFMNFKDKPSIVNHNEMPNLVETFSIILSRVSSRHIGSKSTETVVVFIQISKVKIIGFSRHRSKQEEIKLILNMEKYEKLNRLQNYLDVLIVVMLD